MKPNIPCSAGFFPVIIDDQATDEISGIDDCIFLNLPAFITLWVLGIIPLSERSFSIPKGTPSIPIITIRFLFMIFTITPTYPKVKLSRQRRSSLVSQGQTFQGQEFCLLWLQQWVSLSLLLLPLLPGFLIRWHFPQ